MSSFRWAASPPLTGLLMSLVTPWGLLRHYWVLIALLLTTLTLAVLLLHMPTVTRAADLARSAGDAAAATLGGDVVHPALGLVALVVVAALNIHKPRGLTRFGQRRQPDARARLPRQQQGLRQVDQSSAIEE